MNLWEGFVKMETFLFSGTFWGCILILAGVLAIINGMFHTGIPTFRIIIAVIFVSFGILILSGGMKIQAGGQNSAVFNSVIMGSPSGNNEYSILMGSGIIRIG